MAFEFRYSTKNAECAVAYAVFGAMHTRMEMVIAGESEAAARGFAEAAEREVRRMERLFDRFDAASALAALNARGAAGASKVDDELFLALELCDAFRRGTDGYFDIAAGSAAERAAGGAGYALDPSAHTVRLAAGASLDLGGFAKGYALERLRRMAADAGFSRCVLNFGDSSIAAVGRHPYGEWWPVGLEHTAGGGAAAHEFRLRDSALSVSGRSRGGEYHIFDPHSGQRVARDATVAVEGRSALVAEVLSTALYAAPEARRVAIAARYAGYSATEFLRRRDGGCDVRRIG